MSPTHMMRRFRQRARRDGSTLTVRTEHPYDDVSALNHNLQGLVKPGAPGPGLSGKDELIYHFQIDQDEWAAHRKRHPQLHQDLHSHVQVLREKAAAEIARTHPEWVVCSPRAIRPLAKSVQH